MKPWWIAATQGYLSGRYQRRRERKGIRVFCYHGIIERITEPRLERNFHLLSNFKAHTRFLRRFRVISLAELSEELSNTVPPRQPTAVITFDDGYANNHLAFDILAAARLPWSVFVTAGAIGNGGLIWTVELSLLLLHGSAQSIELFDKVWPLDSSEAREAAFRAIRYHLKTLDADSRLRTMNSIRQQFPADESQRLLERFPSFRMLTWDDLTEFTRAGIEIGSHGVEHEIHHAAQPAAVRKRELQRSKEEIENRLGLDCRFFAYPNGDFHSESAAELESCNYDLAFALNNDLITPGANPYLLPRLHTPSSIEKLSRIFYYGP